MSSTESQKTPDRDAQRWVDSWIRAGAVLAKVRENNVKSADTALAMRSFTGSVLNAVQARPPAPTSGLVEQQRLFGKFRGA